MSTTTFAVSYQGKKWQVWRAVPLMPQSSRWGAGSSADGLLCSAFISWEQFSLLPAPAVLLTLLLQFLLAFIPISLHTSAIPNSVTPCKSLRFPTPLQSMARPNTAAETQPGWDSAVRLVQGMEPESFWPCCWDPRCDGAPDHLPTTYKTQEGNQGDSKYWDSHVPSMNPVQTPEEPASSRG